MTGSSPTWHLGLLTDEGKYVGVEEALGGVDDLVEEHVDPDAEQGKDVEIDGITYQTWTDAGGDYALSREVGVEGGPAYQSGPGRRHGSGEHDPGLRRDPEGRQAAPGGVT